MSSLRVKIMLLGLVPVLAVAVILVSSTLLTGQQSLLDEARADLRGGSALYVSTMRSRLKSLRKTIRAATQSPALQTNIALSDGAADAAIENLRKEFDADIAWLIDRNGTPITNAKVDAQTERQLVGLIKLAEDDESSRGLLIRGERAFETLTYRIDGAESDRWITVGRAIDNDFAASIREATGLDLIVLLTAAEARIVASSLIGVDAAIAPDPTRLAGVETDASTRITIGDGEYMVRERDFMSASQALKILLLVPIAETMAPFSFLMRVIVAVAALAIALVVIAGTTLGKTVADSMARLTDATRHMRDGDFEQPIDSGSTDEVRRMADGLRGLQASLAERLDGMSRRARFDELTGLPNRFTAEENLALAVRDVIEHKSRLSVLLIDLKRFSDIGASFGQDIGSALLRQAAERLRGTIDARHALARMESNEFLIVMPGVSIDAATDVAEELLRLLGAGLSVHDINICVEASIGICSCPDHGEDAAELLMRASVALNDARERPNNIAIYESGKEQHYARQLAILGDLRSAVRQGQLKLYLQPKISLADESICGAEALARWDHPTLGFLPPPDFIAVAERSGNISVITRWALETAISECRLWHEDGLMLPISVNLSVRDLMDPDLPVFVHETLRDHDLDPNYLTVEITEQALLQDFEQANGVLRCLRELGIRIAIDDFGTGHSSLAKLKHLPIDEVKIDQSFVAELPDNRKDIAIVRGTIELAHSLGIEVLAEGIESRPALRWLNEQGCERGQGFLIGRPMPAETFVQWVSHFSDIETQITRIFIRPQSV